jgi:nitrogen fixation/metabolism regulation signal transduction histidine kinase
MSEWQKVARRLAHEIKNPLTPIQLAVEECHRRYAGDDPAFRRIVDTTLEVVEEEIGTLRRLVGEFSSFARLPRADLCEEDLGELLREEATHHGPRASGAPGCDEDAALFGHVDLSFAIDEGAMPALVDREMLHRVIANVLRNAAQALRDARGGDGRERWGQVRLTAKPWKGGYEIDVDDDGPGIAPDVAGTVFDPYVTTKRDGTGLGLSIVKKIVVDHGGTIEALGSPLGGARFRIRLPHPESVAAREALLRSRAATDPELPPSSRRPAVAAG